MPVYPEGRRRAPLLLLAGTLCSNTALAANWLALFGTESADAPLARPLAMIQPIYTRVDADPVTGLVGPQAATFNGRHSISNLVPPNFEHTGQLQILRAKLGARGRITEGINYFALLEAGRNAATAEHRPIISDLSLTFNQIPGARIRAGIFKLPTDEEAAMPADSSSPFNFFSTVVQNLLIEQPVESLGVAISPTTFRAKTSGGCNCFHDWGAQLFDWFQQGPWEYAYAAMVSNGGEIDSLRDDDGKKDLTLRLQAAYLFGGEGPGRDDLTAYLWRQEGERNFGGQTYDRRREGLGARLKKGPLHLGVAYLRGKGMINGGYNPPFSGADLSIGPREEADGWYIEGGWRFHPQWGFDLRHDHFDLMTVSASNTRTLTNTALALQFFPRKDTRLSLNYEWRNAELTHPDAFTVPTALHNAELLADSMGDRASLQLTWIF